MKLGRSIHEAFRVAASSTAASVVDLITLLSLSNLLSVWAGVAGTLGCLAGGAVNFLLCRSWVFGARSRKGSSWIKQALAYGLLVVLGGALISGAIIQLATAELGLPILVAKATAALLVLALWNYPVSSRLVFASGGVEKGASP